MVLHLQPARAYKGQSHLATIAMQGVSILMSYLHKQLQRSWNGHHPDLNQRQDGAHSRGNSGHIHQLYAECPKGQPGEDSVEECQLECTLEDPSQCITEGGCCVLSGRL